MRCYREFMPVRKLSIALEETVAERVAAAAEHQGLSLSAWLNRSAENSLALEDGLAAVREWEAEHGGITAEERADADALLDQVAHVRPKRRRNTRSAARAAR